MATMTGHFATNRPTLHCQQSPWSYKAWLLDLDGTLYRSFPVKLAMAVELTFGNWAAIRPLRTFRKIHEELRGRLADPHSTPFQLQLECTAQRLACSTTRLERLVDEWMFRRPGKWLHWFRRKMLLTAIADFRHSGGKTALVSDYPARRKLQLLGADSLFDVIVANGEPLGPRRLKPWPHGLLLAADRLNIKPVDCLVIGDRIELDGVAAELAGMCYVPAWNKFLSDESTRFPHTVPNSR